MNFGKFIIDRSGEILGYYGPLEDTKVLANAIENALI